MKQLTIGSLILVLAVIAACGDDGAGGPDAGGVVTTEHCVYEPVPGTANAGGTVAAAALNAGAAEAVLPMPIGTALGAYTARAGFLGTAGTVDLRKVAISGAFNPSIGIESAPRVKALALTAGDETVVILKVDLGLLWEGMVFDLESRLGEDFRGKVLITASHSHSAWGQFSAHIGLQVGVGTMRATIYKRFLDTFEATARAALEARVPAKIGFFADSNFDPDDNITRDRRGENNVLPGGDQKDTHFFMIRVDTADGTPLAALPVFGMHGTLNGEENSFASTDSIGGIERHFEESFDTPVVVMHLQGAGSDVSPTGRGDLDCSIPAGDVDDAPCFEWLTADGLGRTALPVMRAAWESAGTSMVSELEIEMLTRTIELGPKPETFAIRDGSVGYAPFVLDRVADREVFDSSGALISPIDEFNAPVGAALCETDYPIFPAGLMPGTDDLPPYGSCVRLDTAGEILGQLLGLNFDSDATHPVCQTTRTTLSALRLGDYVFGTLPGEPSMPLVELIREKSPVAGDKTILLGYAQGHVGYMLRPEDWLLGGYEPSVTFWGPLEAEYIAERLIDLLPLATTATREDAMADGVDRFAPALPVDSYPIDVPAPMAGTIPAEVPERVWLRSGLPASAQPDATVPRVSGIARFVWIGDDPMTITPTVTLEREDTPGSNTYSTVTRRSGRTLSEGEILLMSTSLPVRRVGSEPQTHYYAVEWQAVPWVGAVDGATAIDGLEAIAGVPLGNYRFRVKGDTYEITSDTFAVGPVGLQIGASRNGNNISAGVRVSAPKGYRLLALEEASNKAVLIRGGTCTVELTLAGGGTVSFTDQTIGANGIVTVDAGTDGPNVTSVRVTDAFGNTGSGTL